jgi:hypothetical protein
VSSKPELNTIWRSVGGRNWKGDKSCRICGVVETTDHIFFHCPLAKLLWIGKKEALGWDRTPGGFQDYLEVWLPLGAVNYGTKLFAFATTLWALWNFRNKMMIEGVFVRNQMEVFCKL